MPMHTEMYDIDMNFHEDWQDKGKEEEDPSGSDGESTDDPTNNEK